jgi:PEGA domain
MATDRVARRLLSPVLVGLLPMLLLMQAARPAAAQVDAKAAARVHFEKGVAAFSDRRFAEAAEEFETAYRLSPAFVVLYNIGEVSVALGKSVEAVDAFDKYLKQGASTITEERRQQVLEEIEKQRARIGTISVRTLPEGAAIRLDGALVGKTPLSGPLRVTAGRHTVEAVLAEHAPEAREITVGGRSHESLELTLASLTPAMPPPAAATAPPPEPTNAPRAEHSIIEEHLVVENRGTPAPTIMAPPAETVTAPAPRSSTNWQRIVGIIITVGGVATATYGGVIAYQGINQANDAKARLGMEAGTAYDADKILFDDGKSRNQRGWITAGIGAGVTLAGIIVTATAPERTSTVALAPWVVAGSGGLTMSGAF